MSLENSTFQFGDTVYPLDIDGYQDGYSLLHDVDSGIFKALEFFKSVLDTHLLNRWKRETAAVNLSSINGSLVATKIPYDPMVYSLEESFKFPLLAVYRTADDITEHSTSYYKTTSIWKCLYIMPPMSTSQFERLAPMLKAVSDVIINRIELGSDGYYNSGERVWLSSGISSIGVIRREFGNIPGDKSNLFFPTVSMDIMVKETLTPLSNAFSPLSSVAISEDLASTNTVTLADVVQILKEI